MAEVQERVLRGERISLTPLHMENIYMHFEWNNDRELNRLDSEAPLEEETFSAFKKRFEQMVYRPSRTVRDFEIHTEDGTLIGIAFVGNLSEHHRHCIVGLTIGERACWGRGYGRETMELLLGYCFDELGMHRVGTDTFEYNESWRNLVQDTGFQREGVEREYLSYDGRFWDKEIYGMLESEYRQRARRPSSGRKRGSKTEANGH